MTDVQEQKQSTEVLMYDLELMHRLIIKDKRYLKEAVRSHLFSACLDTLNSFINKDQQEEDKSVQSVVFYLMLVLFTVISFIQINQSLYLQEVKKLYLKQEENKQ